MDTKTSENKNLIHVFVIINNTKKTEKITLEKGATILDLKYTLLKYVSAHIIKFKLYTYNESYTNDHILCHEECLNLVICCNNDIDKDITKLTKEDAIYLKQK